MHEFSTGRKFVRYRVNRALVSRGSSAGWETVTQSRVVGIPSLSNWELEFCSLSSWEFFPAILKNRHAMRTCCNAATYTALYSVIVYTPVSYSNGWTGSSMQWRLMRAN